MNTRKHRSVCIVLVLAGFLAASPAWSAQEAARPKEPDKRLQADGKGWRLDKAVIKDPARGCS